MIERPPAKDEQTRQRMMRQARADTRPELAVRAALRELGHRYRVTPATLPGRPDVANAARRWAIFVHGCYWHQHPGCRRATVPANNRDWWLRKFEQNRARDARKVADLEALGLAVIVVWECETGDSARLIARLAACLPSAPPPE